MKKLVFPTLFLLFAAFQICSAQWVRQNSGSVGNLSKIVFADKVNGWILTNNKRILRTTNGGDDWNTIITDQVFYDIKGLNKDTAFVIAGDYSENICRTTDGGFTWSKLFTLNSISDISVIDKNNIFVSSRKKIYKSTDGGTSWNEIPFPYYASDDLFGQIYYVRFISKDLGWLLYKNYLYITRDGGATFTFLNSPQFYSIYFMNDKTGFGMNGGKIYKSTDSGTTWNLTGGDLGIMYYFRFLSENSGYWIGNYSFGKINKSFYQTENLTPVNLVGAQLGYTDFWAADDDNIWIIKENGFIAKRSNAKYISIVTPAANRIVYTGYKINIEWDYSNLAESKCRIEYSYDNGASWNTIADSLTVSNGGYYWDTKNVLPRGNCLLRIYEYNNGLLSAAVPFTLIKEQRTITIISPAKGDVSFFNQKKRVELTANYTISKLRGDVYYWSGSDSSHYGIESYVLKKDSLGYYITFPQYVSGNGKLVIYEEEESQITGSSNVFTLVRESPVQIVTPQSGEVVRPGTSYNITFKSALTPAADIQISSDAGRNWNYLRKDYKLDSLGYNTNTLNWTPPSLISTRYKLRISSRYGSDSCWVFITDKETIGEFPLKTGNKWFYKYRNVLPVYADWAVSKNIRLMAEIKGKVQKGNSEFFEMAIYIRYSDTAKTLKLTALKYLRQEKNLIIEYVNNEEKTICDFTNQTFSTYLWYGKIMDKFFRQYSYFRYGGNNYTVSDSLGFSRLYYVESNSGINYYGLYGCVINGISIGEIPADYTLKAGENSGSALPEEYILYNNYPNPFNPETTLEFSLPQRKFVTLKIYDILGREAATLVKGEMDAGRHRVLFNAGNLSSGTYIYTLTAGTFSRSGKMLLLK